MICPAKNHPRSVFRNFFPLELEKNASQTIPLLVLTMVLAMVSSATAEPSVEISIEPNHAQHTGVSGDDPFEGAEIEEAVNVFSEPASDPRDLFGGSFSQVEPGILLGSDEGAMLEGCSVRFATPSQVTIDGFELFLAEDADANGARSAKQFEFYQGDKLVAAGAIDTPYSTYYGHNQIKVIVKFDTPVTGDKWRIDLLGGTGLGVRALELDAIRSSNDK